MQPQEQPVGWIILQGGNRGGVLTRSVEAIGYGDLSDCDVACGDECGGGFNDDDAMGGGIGSVTCAQWPVMSVVEAPYWARSQSVSVRYRT
jgi:hypothetical protein